MAGRTDWKKSIRKRLKWNAKKKPLYWLRVATAGVVALAVVVLGYYAVSAQFDIHNFIRREANVAGEENSGDIAELPELSGVSNLLFTCVPSDSTYLSFAVLLQADLDNACYTICSLPADLKVGGTTLYELVRTGKGAAASQAISDDLGIEIDRYIHIQESNFKKAVQKLGYPVYSFSDEIRYSAAGENSFSLRIKAGEQSLTGEQIINLFRYAQEEDIRLQNELFLSIINQTLSPDNYEKRESLFETIINLIDTNITVADYNASQDALLSLSSGFVMAGLELTLSGQEENKQYVLDSQSRAEFKDAFSKLTVNQAAQ